MSSLQQKSKQLELPLMNREKGAARISRKGVEGLVAGCQHETSVVECSLLEEVLERGNLLQALKQVRSNGGGPGIDGMTVDKLPKYLKENWQRIKAELLSGMYQPSPVKRVEIPKPCGGKRELGIPTVLDRFIQQSLNQVLQKKWDSSFSPGSFGFRPNLSAHYAITQAQRNIRMGRQWVVDIDLEKFFDRVNHDKLMGLLSKRIKDKRVLILIRKYLNSGVLDKGLFSRTEEGTPQGGPLSPLLSNIMLDVLDKELEKRGHKFARYADDCNVYVRSRKAGERVMRSLKEFLEKKLKLKINETKSKVERPWKRKFLGFTFSRTYRGGVKRKVAEESIKRLKHKVRELTGRTRGISLRGMVRELGVYLKGWMGYFGFTEVKSVFKELDKWIRRRLRSMLLKQWGRRRYKELRNRGIDRQLAWNTCKSAHGPWRLSHSPALEIALSVSFFEKFGLLQLGNMI